MTRTACPLTYLRRLGFMEHYRQAGEMLLEAKEQLTDAKWGAWLSKTIELSRTTAWRYMKLAQDSFPALLGGATGDHRQS